MNGSPRDPQSSPVPAASWPGLVALPLIGILLTTTAFILSHQAAWKDVRTEFEAMARERAMILEQSLRQHEADVSTLARLFDSSDDVHRGEFHVFASPQPGHASVRAKEWIPRVQLGNRAAVEAQARSEGVSGYEFKEFGPRGNLVRAETRKDYYPVLFVEPVVGNEAALGFDLASNPERWSAMEKAAGSGRVVATAPVHLIQQQQYGDGLLLIAPVYAKGPDVHTPEDRRTRCRGFVLEVLRAGEMSRVALEPLNSIGIVIRLLDRDAPVANTLLHERQPELKAGNSSDTFTETEGPAIRFDHDFEFGTRHYRISAKPNDRFIAKRLSQGHWWILPAGLLVTGLVAFQVRTLATQSARAEAIVDSRTSALRESEQRFRLMADRAPVLIWLSGTDKLCNFFNETWLQFTGRTMEQEMGNGWAEGVHPDDLSKCLDIYTGCFDRRESFRMEYRLKRHDGEYRWILDHGVPRIDAKGRFEGYIGSCIDITDQIQTAEQRQSLAQDSAFLNQCIAEFAVKDTFDAALETLLQHALNLGRLDCGAICLIGGQTVQVRHQVGLEAGFIAQATSHPTNAPHVEFILDHGAGPAELLTRFPDLAAMAGTFGLRHLYGIRLVVGASPIGFILGASRKAEPPLAAGLQRLPLLITELQTVHRRLAAEAEVRRLVEEQRVILETVPLTIGLFRERKAIWVNREYESMFGYTASETIGHDTAPIYPHASDYDRVGRAGYECLSKGGLYFTEAEMRRKDGSTFWGEIMARAVDPADLAKGTIWVVSNISSRKAAAQSLEAAKRKYDRLVAHIPSGVYLHRTSANGTQRFEYVSPKAAALLGVSVETLLADPTAALSRIPTPDAAGFRTQFREAGKDLVPFDWEGRCLVGEQIRWLRINAVPESQPHGDTLWSGVVSDITARRELETSLRQAQKMEGIGHLAGGMAHEFNNILASFLMSLSIFKADPTGPQSPQLLEDMESGCNRAADLIRKLLAFSSRSMIQLRPMRLEDTLTDHVRVLRGLLGERTEIQLILDPDLPRVRADRSLMEQVLMNLCLNAQDAMHGAGSIRIALSRVELTAADLQQSPEATTGPHLCLAVSDTGRGMDETMMQRLFEPFFTTKEVGKGTGLGLATVRGIVQQHRGWVQVHSKPGEGSTFSVYLPAIDELKGPLFPQPPPAQVGIPGAARRTTVLVVEDDPHLRKLTRSVLAMDGYEVLEAPNATLAMEIWKNHRDHIDLLYTDVAMPGGMNGSELAQHLLSEKPELKVIITSGYHDGKPSSDSKSHNSPLYMEKPCPAHILRSNVAMLLGGTTNDSHD